MTQHDVPSDSDPDGSSALSRRQFLIAAGLGLAGLSAAGLACGRGQGQPAPTGAPPSLPSPTAAGVARGPSPAPPGSTSVAAGPSVAPTNPPPTASGPGADLVLFNGKVITVDASDSIAQAVAVRDGRIQAVGTNAEIEALAGPQTRTIDLTGRVLTPGLIDAHNHLQIAGLMNSAYVALLPPDVRSLDDMRAKLAEVVAQKPEGEWIQAYFLVVSEGRLPTRHDLDPVSPRHPVWVLQQGGHYGSANSLALQAAGITSATPDPVGGVIERDARGEPTGVFYNHRAMDVLRRVIPVPTPEMVRDNIVSSQPLFATYGVTTFHDNNVRGTDTVAAYQEVGRDGQMMLRGSVYYTLEWPNDLDRALHEIDYGGDDMMRFAGFKFLIDGQGQMAYCHQPHNGVRWDLPTWEPKSFKDAVRALHDTGLQICVHCVGDAAVDLTLDAYEAAMNANPRPDPRHRIEHCILTTPQATQRMADLGVVVCTQPQFLRVGAQSYVSVFGAERARRVMVTREWLDGGVKLALGSDSPTTPWYSPQVTIMGAVTRLTLENTSFEPAQALTVQEALRAHTMGAAYAGHEEGIKGSIEVGKLADLVVWSEDPYVASLKRLSQIPMDLTLVNGRVIYERS